MSIDWETIHRLSDLSQIQRLMEMVLESKHDDKKDSGKYYWELFMNQIDKDDEDDDNDEIQQRSSNTSLWDAVKNYFIEERFEYTRQDLLSYVEYSYGHSNQNSIDTYRNYLHKAGYLETIRRGVYRKIKEIPVDISVDEVREEAYRDIRERKNNKEFITQAKRISDIMSPTLFKKKKNEFLTKDEMML